MQYTYEFIKVEPKRSFLQIKYSSEGVPDIWKNCITTDFSIEGLTATAKSFVPSIIVQWNNIKSAPEEVTLSESIFTETYKLDNYLERPEYDEFTQKLEEVITETETEILHSWNVLDKTQEEKDEVLNRWRGSISVTMRQARLALIQQGLLGQVNAAIASMPEPEKSIVETEWEYAATVERKSPWIATLAPALNMTEEDMDNLFKLAATL